MKEKMSNKKVVSGLIWRFLERCGAQGVTFIVSLILARLLDPSDYGMISIVTVFTAILQVFVDSGMASALVQKKDADDIDFSSVFYLNILICIMLYVLMFFTAPFIERFYNLDGLGTIIRVMCLSLIISGVKNIQQAYVSKYMLFKKFFYSTLIGTIISAILGIWFAYRGFGVWALVIQILSNQFIDTIVLWITVKWRPRLVFSIQSVKSLFSFGWKMLVSSLVDTIYNKFVSLMIGKVYSTEDLAFYNKGEGLPMLIITNANSALDSVLFPVMAERQEELLKVKEITRRAIKLSTYIFFPAMLGLAVCAEPLIKLLYTEKWIACVPYVVIFSVIYALYPIHTANLNVLRALGRSDIFLRLEVIKKIVGIVLILVMLRFGVIYLSVGILISSFIATILNARPNKTLIGYSIKEQILDVMPHLLLSLAMGIVVYVLSKIPIADAGLLVIQLVVGITLYLLGSYIFKIEAFGYMFHFFKYSRIKDGK